MKTSDIKPGQALRHTTRAGETIIVKPVTTDLYTGNHGVQTVNTRQYKWAWSNDAIYQEWRSERKHLLRSAGMEGKDCEFPDVYIKNAVVVRHGDTMLLVNPRDLSA